MIIGTVTRNPSEITVETAVSKEGKILGRKVEVSRTVSRATRVRDRASRVGASRVAARGTSGARRPDTVRRRGAIATLLSSFAAGELDVLVGTQMIAKGHDFPRVTLVGAISADVGPRARRLPRRRTHVSAPHTGCWPRRTGRCPLGEPSCRRCIRTTTASGTPAIRITAPSTPRS